MRKSSVEAILNALNQASVRYLVAGGLAVVAHGHLRTTVDVDLILDLNPENVNLALSALSKLGFRPRAPVPLEQFADSELRKQWIAQKGLTVFSLHSDRHAETEIDLFVENPLDFDSAYASAYRIPLSDAVEIPFVSRDDLIRLKRLAGRPQDLADINSLLTLGEADER